MQIFLQDRIGVIDLPKNYRAEERTDENGNPYGVVMGGKKYDILLGKYNSFERAVEIVGLLFEARRNSWKIRCRDYIIPKE